MPLALTAGGLIGIIVLIALGALMWMVVLGALGEIVVFLGETLWAARWVIAAIAAFIGLLWLLIAAGILEGW